MRSTFRVAPATTVSLDAFADLFKRSFDGYFYPNNTTAAVMARRIRTEQIDLARTLILLVDDEPAGQAALALRDQRAWCGGFGIVPAFRGRGLAHHLADAMVAQARETGARSLQLEVLTRNVAAFTVYQRVGLQPKRDLLIMSWTASPTDQTKNADPMLETVSPQVVIDAYPPRVNVGAAWQRELATLLARTDLLGKTLATPGGQAAVVIAEAPDNSASIAELRASSVEAAIAIVRALQGQYRTLVCVNEPADSPWLAAYQAAGFAETDRQHEMRLAL